MRDMLERDSTFVRIECEEKESARLAEDERLAREGQRDEFIGQVEEWVGGRACRDELDEYDIQARAVMRFCAVVCGSEEPILN